MRLTVLSLIQVVLLCALIAPGVQAAKRDTTPDPFSFVPKTGVEPGAVVTSDSITVTGINAAATITVTGGLYSVNNGSFTSARGSVSNGASVRVRQTASSAFATTTTTVLTIGGVKGNFAVTTRPFVADTTPDPFAFGARADVALNALIASDPVTVTGIDAPAPVSVSGGTYSVNGGASTSAPGWVNSGDSVTVHVMAAAEYATTRTVTLTIGGMTATFSVTTLVAPDVFLLPPASGGLPTFVSEHFSGSGNCTLCHNNIRDGQGNDVSIETDWSSTMMANAARDPLWRAKVRSELNRNPHLAHVINDKCTRCHAPMANFEAKQAGESLQILDGGFLSANHNRHDQALGGVGCTLCHQIQNSPKLGTLAGFTGQYEIGDQKLIYGPFDNLFPNPMIMHTGYTPTYSPHVKESKLCGACHNLKTPYVDASGNLTTTPESEFPEQMPYSEWEHSSYATTQPKSCQQCHMSRADGAPISNRPMWLERRNGFALHEFVGGNKLMLDIFDRNKQQLGVLSNNFAETIAKTEAMLQGAATIAPVNPKLDANGVLDFTLRVNSQTGH
nr:hypothetical protein [Methylotetracoccus sp.]